MSPGILLLFKGLTVYAPTPIYGGHSDAVEISVAGPRIVGVSFAGARHVEVSAAGPQAIGMVPHGQVE